MSKNSNSLQKYDETCQFSKEKNKREHAASKRELSEEPNTDEKIVEKNIFKIERKNLKIFVPKANY